MNIVTLILIPMLSGFVMADSFSEESGAASTGNSGNNAADFNAIRQAEQSSVSQEEPSSSLSEEHPLEHYVDDTSDKKPLRSLRSSCRRKLIRFCVKACRRTYKDSCKDYVCRSGLRRSFKVGCKRNCKSRY